MYRYSNGQISLADFAQSVGMHLDKCGRIEVDYKFSLRFPGTCPLCFRPLNRQKSSSLFSRHCLDMPRLSTVP